MSQSQIIARGNPLADNDINPHSIHVICHKCHFGSGNRTKTHTCKSCVSGSNFRNIKKIYYDHQSVEELTEQLQKIQKNRETLMTEINQVTKEFHTVQTRLNSLKENMNNLDKATIRLATRRFELEKEKAKRMKKPQGSSKINALKKLLANMTDEQLAELRKL